MAAWPTVEDVARRAQVGVSPTLTENLETATERIVAELDPVVVPPGPNCPASVRDAISDYAAHLLSQRSPGANSLDAPVLRTEIPAGVWEMIAPYTYGPDPECG